MAGRRNHYNDRGFTRGKITGMRDGLKTIADLRELGNHVVQAAKEALRQGVDIVVADAKSRCPVKTGRLRDSIKAVSNSAGTVYAISANAFRTDNEGRTYYYGAGVEFDPKINKPFLYPAMDAHRNEVYSMVENAISDAIRRGS